MKKAKVIRITTVPISMNKILVGQLGYMNEFYDVVGVSSYVEKDFNEIREREKIRMETVPMHREISPINDLKSLFQLIRLLRKEKPEIVHSHTPKAGLIGMLAAYFAGVPIRLHTVGGMPLMETTGLKLQVLKLVEKITYRCAHQVLPNSKGLAEFILDNKFTKSKKIKVIGHGSSNGIDFRYYKNDFPNSKEEYSKLRKELGLNENDFVFLFIGRLSADKGVEELLTAFEEFEKKHPNSGAKLLLVGPLEKVNAPISEQSLKTIQESQNIIYPGRTDDVRLFLGLGDCFVLPTYREGFPNILLQAGAMSLPIITTDINGCNEIVNDGIDGVLVPPKQAEPLALKMEELYSNENLRETFSRKIREKIEKHYDNLVIWEALHQEYEYWLKKIGK